MTHATLTYFKYASNLQQQAARLASLARDYRELGPTWYLQACTMQALAAKHYEMSRNAVHFSQTGDPDIVGRGTR